MAEQHDKYYETKHEASKYYAQKMKQYTGTHSTPNEVASCLDRLKLKESIYIEGDGWMRNIGKYFDQLQVELKMEKRRTDPLLFRDENLYSPLDRKQAQQLQQKLRKFIASI